MSRPARIARAVTGRVGTTVVTGLMLFALFFGAGNLIFPPVLGASAGIERSHPRPCTCRSDRSMRYREW